MAKIIIAVIKFMMLRAKKY